VISEILLFLFVINLGIAFGAGLYEMRIVLPLWFTKSAGGYRVNHQAMREIDTGRKFWGMVTTLPLTILTVANLVLAFRSGGLLHDWWLAASVVVLAERIATFAFFIPTAIKLQKSETMEASKVGATVATWVRVNYVRILLNAVGLVAAMRALMLISQA